ncbi:MAG: aminotransferase class V-fold PLP-dependent enzyme [Pseudomonadota bacterium]
MVSALSNRHHYSSLDKGIYLNQASLGLVGQPAVAAMQEFLENIARHGNMYLTDDEEVELFAPLRKSAAKLFNCPAEQLAIIGSAGEMLSQLPYLFAPPAGGQILAIASDFPAITRPWSAFAADHGLSLVFIDEIRDQPITETLIDAINENTSVILASYVQFSTGSRLNCKKLRKAAQKVNARLVIDVTQAAGAIPIDTSAWQADVIVCSGYKWLGGHGGVGLAVLAPELLEVTPPMPGWMGAPDPFDMQATGLPLAPDARRFTQSTMSYVSIVGLAVAIEELLKLAPDKIVHHSKSLAQTLSRVLEGTGWEPYRELTDPSASSHIITLGHATAEADATLSSLLSSGITCSIRNGRVRVSLAHYNNSKDLEKLSDALKAIEC